jgi:uncharacterized tellurite resistance protein B-like protein
MGLFDNVFDSKSADEKLEKPEAFAGILLCASACDGHVADEEIRDLFTITARMKLFGGIAETQWNSMMNGLNKALRRDGVDKMLDRCVAAMPEELRDCVFANACDIILADGDVQNTEKEFLDRLQDKLAIDRDTALTIVEVLVIKNRG